MRVHGIRPKLLLFPAHTSRERVVGFLYGRERYME